MEKSIKEQIYDYIKENPGCESVNITTEFQNSSMPILLMATVGSLIRDNKIERYSIGAKYGYRIVPEKKKACEYFDINVCRLGLTMEDCPYIYTKDVVCH